MRRFILTALVGAAAWLSVPVSAAPAKPDLAAAVARAGRPAEAIALDTSRKPAETLAFLGLKQGMSAADIMTGSGYWAEIIANAVGPKGKVTAFEPNQFYTAPDEIKKWDALVARRPDVNFVRYPFESFASKPGSFDFVIINLSYHDLYWESEKYKIPRTDPAAFLKTLYAATKPGGVVGIIDHVGPAGDTRAVVDKLHRIDPATVKADFKAAGFVLEAESPLLANPADDHGKLVFDPAVRGKTDRFLYRFRKPR
ncbi:class I SAM-dependent methyltransferase [Sphingomonas colocasiae]|uniref:Methyltransferase domain-containing protein n=1 Tax=Sphingomonas colocasiae TaxID=1848973 RepID=A0ABS7PMY7_9SPHN|nr:methyltransferase domain-containing protein [Sphingomonas colocasiae]MBY8822586.1 methyltransferase domain-containing protein [Sphingomonas colocasiae]